MDKEALEKIAEKAIEFVECEGKWIDGIEAEAIYIELRELVEAVCRKALRRINDIHT